MLGFFELRMSPTRLQHESDCLQRLTRSRTTPAAQAICPILSATTTTELTMALQVLFFSCKTGQSPTSRLKARQRPGSSSSSSIHGLLPEIGTHKPVIASLVGTTNGSNMNM